MTNKPINEQALFVSAVQYATEAGRLIAKRMRVQHQIEGKVNHADLVTEADRISEAFIRGKIAEDYPDHWILSEETDGSTDPFEWIARSPDGCGWIIDPIDGTINYIHGIAHFAVSIGVMKDGRLLHGVVYNPLTHELFHATAGGGAYLNQTRIRVRTDRSLDQALLATGFQAADWKPDSIAASQVGHTTGISRSVRILGAASLDLCLVACGQLSGFWHDGLYPWDVAAGLLIVREAGGVVTDASGKTYALSDRTLVASNPDLQGALLALLYDSVHLPEITNL